MRPQKMMTIQKKKLLTRFLILTPMMTRRMRMMIALVMTKVTQISLLLHL